MADRRPEYYWDTCVFIAYLNDDRDAYGSIIDDIGQFLDEALRGEVRIHCSTITIAEITRSNMAAGRRGNFPEFLQAHQSAVVAVTPDNNIMSLASELRSLTYTKTGGIRKLLTPDAIHLASAIALDNYYGVSLTAC